MNFEILVETAKASGKFAVQPNSLFVAASTHEALAVAGGDADIRHGVYPLRILGGSTPDHPATGDEIGKEYFLLFQTNGMSDVFTLNETDIVTSTDQNDAFVSALTQTQELGYPVGLLAKPADTATATTTPDPAPAEPTSTPEAAPVEHTDAPS